MTERDFSIFDNMIEGVQIVDREYRYLYVNDAVAAHGKSTRQALLGMRMEDAYPGIEKTVVFSRIRSCIEEKRFHHMVNEFKFPDGSTGYFQLRIQPIPEGALILSFDVTEQRRAELAMEDLNRELEARVQERTAALKRSNEELLHFAYVASHDLKEPLRTVASFVQLIEQRYGPRLDEKGLRYIRFAVDATRRMEVLITSLLELSHIETSSQAFVRIETAEAVRLAMENLAERIAAEEAEVVVGELPAVVGDPTQMTRLFQNLLGNAIKFRRPDVRPRIEISAREEGDWWSFLVADNGIGVAEQDRDRIFQMFQRLHSRADYPGSGIGLAICRKIVERHGGRIRVEPTPGQGATFVFTLPAVQGGAFPALG